MQTIAELLKELPTTGGLSLTMNNEDGQFAKALVVLKKICKMFHSCAKVCVLNNEFSFGL